MKILFLDIETAPHRAYVWGLWDQRIALNQVEEPGYTLCYAAQWFGSRKVMFDSIPKSSKVRMLRSVYNLLEEADAVCHYNGASFDIPVLRGEFMEQHWGPPAPFAQIDLIKVARSARMASRKMDYLSERLGLRRKIQHKGMELWRGCMAGDAGCWRVMEKYNKQDVRMTHDLYVELRPWVKGHPNLSGYAREHVCPSCGSHALQRRGVQRTASRTYARYHCQGCGAWSQSAKAEPGSAPLRGVA